MYRKLTPAILKYVHTRGKMVSF